MQKENQLKSYYKNILSSREVVARDLPHPTPLFNKEKQSCFTREVEGPALYPALQPCGMTPNLMGFTLIELLVVVLIIGILAAVALPQYQNAVEKSRATQALTLLKSVSQAADAYYLANGTHVRTFDELAVDIPWQNSTEGIGSHLRSKSNGYWAINIDNSGTILVLRLSGKYQGAFFSASPTNERTIVCIERKKEGSRIFTAEPGSFCEKIMKGTLIDDNIHNRVYSLP